MDEKASILVVDDLPEKLLVFQTILEELGQELVFVRSGAEALRQVLEREFAVILLDVNMPDIDGLETAQLIRQYKPTAHTPIIFVTAYADEMQTARGYSLGAVDYILSPVVPEILRSKVRVFVELFRMQRRARQTAKAEAARAAAEEAQRRSSFLAQASRELGASLELEAAMRRLLAVVVPAVAAQARLRVEPGDGPALVLGSVERLERSLELRSGEAQIGALELAKVDARFDAELLEELARLAGIAFDNARLYRRLEREMRRARAAEEKLQEANRRKDEFLAMLSHELRNPLAPIRNAVEMIRRVAPADTRVEWAREVVERQVTHLTGLVEELLDVSRISQGKITLKKEPVDIAKVLSHSVETVRPLVESRGHHLAVQPPPGPVWVVGDFARLSQVLSNLLNNAAKYTEDGGHIELTASALDGRVTISVRDNGMGIESELLPHVFELFAQGTRSLDRSQGGMGVGLTLVRRLVEMHSGTVQVESDGLGKGAEFRVVLPCISEVGAASPAPSEPQGACTRHRVLVVDDNEDNARTLAALLSLEGHEVKVICDSLQALASAQVFEPQVVLLDIGLPGMNGYEVAKRLRKMPQTADALIVALTGYGQKEDVARAKASGFDHHFVKPVDPRNIQRVIAEGRRPAAPGEQAAGNAVA